MIEPVTPAPLLGDVVTFNLILYTYIYDPQFPCLPTIYTYKVNHLLSQFPPRLDFNRLSKLLAFSASNHSHDHRTKTDSYPRVRPPTLPLTPFRKHMLNHIPREEGGGLSREREMVGILYNTLMANRGAYYRAGVIGLTTALVLSRGNDYNKEEEGEGTRSKKGYEITVAAKYMPGDLDVEYASPWAGAHYLPLVIKNTSLLHCMVVMFFLLSPSYILQKIPRYKLIIIYYY